MKTRTGLFYPVVDDDTCKKRRRYTVGEEASDFFDGLPDDLVVSILCKLSSSASCPSDFINVLSSCKRFKGLALRSMVLAKASTKMLAVRAKNWSESPQRFLKLCADAGNVEAYFILGMIRFYCLQNRRSGTSLLAKAAIGSHAPALYSLGVIQFNGSGGMKGDKDLHAGVALCARAAFLGHIDALRELGHCLQDGYGVKKNFTEGRRFLIQANARELSSVLSFNPEMLSTVSLYTDFGCNVPPREPHPANRFLTEWFQAEGLASGLRQCSHVGCGRPETRKHEFRRCSICGAVNYCSRACQALDWKTRHKMECVPVERWLMEPNGGVDVNVGGNGGANGGGEMNGNEEMVVVDS